MFYFFRIATIDYLTNYQQYRKHQYRNHDGENWKLKPIWYQIRNLIQTIFGCLFTAEIIVVFHLIEYLQKYPKILAISFETVWKIWNLSILRLIAPPVECCLLRYHKIWYLPCPLITKSQHWNGGRGKISQKIIIENYFIENFIENYQLQFKCEKVGRINGT